MWKASFALVVRHGADRLMSSACRYHIPSIAALGAVLRESRRQEQWQEYVADMSCLMVKRLSNKFDAPLYSTMVRKHKNLQDSRSGQQIVDDVIAKWRRKRNASRGDSQ